MALDGQQGRPPLHGHSPICDDGEVTTPLHRATAAYKRAQTVVVERRKDLVEAIREADREGTKQVDIVKITGFTREHIRRIVGHQAERD